MVIVFENDVAFPDCRQAGGAAHPLWRIPGWGKTFRSHRSVRQQSFPRKGKPYISPSVRMENIFGSFAGVKANYDFRTVACYYNLVFHAGCSGDSFAKRALVKVTEARIWFFAGILFFLVPVFWEVFSFRLRVES